MAFGIPTFLNLSQNKSASTQLTIAMSGASVAGGSVFGILVAIAKDNTSTTAGDNSEVTQITDSGGNTYVKVAEFTNAGSAGAAITISLWYADAVNALTTSNAINIDFAASTTAKAAAAWKFSKSASATLEVGAFNTASADGANTGQSISVTPPDNREWLFVRSEAAENTSSNGAMWAGVSSGWDSALEEVTTSGGGATSNVYLSTEIDISTTGSAKTSNPGDGGLPAADQASIIFCLKEVSTVPVVGRANETDTASARGIAAGHGQSNETDTASAIFPKVVLAIQRPIETDTAFNRGSGLAASRATETDVAFALSNAAQIPVGRADETDSSFRLAIAHGVNRANETDTASTRGIATTVQRANEVDTAFARPQLGGVGLALETDTAFAPGKKFILPCGGSNLIANGNFDQAFLGDFVSFDATLTVVAGRLRVTATSNGDQDQQGRVNVTTVTGRWYRTTGQGFAGTNDALIDFSGPPLDPQLNTSFDLVYQAIGTLIQVQCRVGDNDPGTIIGDFAEFDNLAVFPYTVETDTAFALNRLDTPAWAHSNEVDTAFGFTVGIGHGRSDEADSAFARSAIFIRAVSQANEADSAFALNRLVTVPVARADEVCTAFRLGFGTPAVRANEADTAFARSAVVTIAHGFSIENDTAFQMFGALEAGSGRKPYIKGNEGILRDRRQPVYKTV